MTTAEKIAFYMPQINEMAYLARSVNFDIVNGDIMDLARMWYKESVKTYIQIEDNRENSIHAVKFLLSKVDDRV